MTTGWEPGLGAHPFPPLNAMAFHPLSMQGAVDLRWDDPTLLAHNSSFNLVGVNIYRSDVSDRGPYFGPINDFPVGGGFYRDRTTATYVDREAVDWASSWSFKGDAPNDRRWVLCTQYPIVQNTFRGQFGQPVYGNAPTHVVLYINGVEVPVDRVVGRSGEVTLIDQAYFEQATENITPSVLPTEDDVVEISYYRHTNFIRSGLDFLTYYRIVTVALDPTSPTGYLETPLSYTQPVNYFNVEEVDWTWREAIRRNHWILQQGGERVKLFIRRTAGIPCDCRLNPHTLEYTQQPLNSCTRGCIGTGYLGGYEGPYDIIIVQDGAENRISQRDKGRKKEKTQDVWMTLTPLVTQRDFIVKLTGERFSIGPVTRQTARGAILQQSYNIGYIEESDVRYTVPIDGTDALIQTPQTRYAQTPEPRQPVDGDTAYQGQQVLPVEPPYPLGNEERWPEVTDKDHAVIPEERQRRGRTPVFEDIEY